MEDKKDRTLLKQAKKEQGREIERARELEGNNKTFNYPCSHRSVTIHELLNIFLVLFS